MQNRRMKHISEQKRRFNIKIGFHTLNSLVSTNSKSVSNVAALIVKYAKGEGAILDLLINLVSSLLTENVKILELRDLEREG